MKRLGLLAAACTLPFWSIAALAEEGPNSPMPPYGYGHMWGRGWEGGGYGPGFLLHPIVMLFALVGLVAVVMWLVRMLNHGSPYPFHGEGVPSGRPGQGRALEILAERFARGEIDKAEFEEKRKLLGP